jgi:hypothetical protein
VSLKFVGTVAVISLLVVIGYNKYESTRSGK